MSKPLSRLLRREQFAFLGRDKRAWTEHLMRVRAFLGEGLQAADPSRPVVVLGAGTGLEVPWDLAPLDTTGWDADPWSQIWTALRHRRWVPWVFEDLTGGMVELEAVARRAVAEPWSGRRRGREAAIQRLTGLLPTLNPDPGPLRAWIARHRPGAILAANVMGQFGVVAERLVEQVFGWQPWNPDPEGSDPLAEALDDWTRKAIQGFLCVLVESGADLWLVHDRAVVVGGGSPTLGGWEDSWPRQLMADGPPLEVSDPLLGMDVLAFLKQHGIHLDCRERWLWDLASGQRHLVEALSCRHPRETLVFRVNPCPHGLLGGP